MHNQPIVMANQPGWAVPNPGGHHHQYPEYQQQHRQYPQQNAPHFQYPIQQQQPMVDFYPQQNGYNQPLPPPAYQHQPFPAPIQQQPNFRAQHSGDWLSNADFSNYLRNATSFHVKQKVELLEALIGWETGNKYTVKDNSGHKVFYVGEETGVCSRICLGSVRPFELVAKDTRGVDILRMSRPVNCSCCCGLLCPDSVTISTTTGQTLGTVVQDFSLVYPSFTLQNAAGSAVLKLTGPACATYLGSCGRVAFRLSTMDGVSIGTISKEWSGLARELFTDADFFSISFPIDLEPAMKAVCLAALFLIDFEYYEHSKD